MLDKFDCYELCVQSPRHVAGFLRALVSGGGAGVGPSPILAEDFCGTAAVSRRWAADAARLGEEGPAFAADLDAQTLDKARALAREDAAGGAGLQFIHADVTQGPALPPAHCVFVGNFSIGYLHDRPALVDYLRRSKARLDAVNMGFGCSGTGLEGGGGGAFVCDLYGGAGAFRLGSLDRRHPSRGREIIRYHWEHEEADPVSAMVTNSISFRVELDGEIIAELPRAFVYRWRLWGLSELREAMLEAGFRRVEVYKDVNIAPGQAPTPLPTPAALDDLANAEGDWTLLVAARV